MREETFPVPSCQSLEDGLVGTGAHHGAGSGTRLADLLLLRCPQAGRFRPGISAANNLNPKIMTLSKLTRWDPIREMADIQNRFATLMGRTPLQLSDNGEETLTTSEWVPPVDIVEDDKEYVIKAELPEIPKDQVKVSVENGLLTISGERKFEKEEKNKKYHRVERAYGYFSRCFSLPDAADADQVKADYKDGVLQVHVPKSERAKAKRVEVKVA